MGEPRPVSVIVLLFWLLLLLAVVAFLTGDGQLGRNLIVACLIFGVIDMIAAKQ